MDLAIVSDTHVPTRESTIPSAFRDRIADADHTIHAGDFESPDVLADLRETANAFTAVYGNADDATLGLAAVAEVDAGEVTFVVTHGTRNLTLDAVNGTTDGSVLDREEWLRAIADTARASEPARGTGRVSSAWVATRTRLKTRSSRGSAC